VRGHLARAAECCDFVRRSMSIAESLPVKSEERGGKSYAAALGALLDQL
jgi:hypothetical protein